MNRKLRPAIELTYTIIVGICYIAYVNGLVCLSCNDASDLDDCLTSTATCQDGTEWFWKKRIKEVSFWRSQCCNTPPNSTLIPCNGYIYQQSPALGPYCGVCDRTRVSDPQLCSGVSKCPVDQICDVYLKGYKDVHPGNHLTNKGTDHGDISLCSACCDGFECNKNECRTMIKNQPCYNSTICG